MIEAVAVYIVEAFESDGIGPWGFALVVPPTERPLLLAVKYMIPPAYEMDSTPTKINLRVCKTFAEYRTLLAAIQADLERQGVEVVRVNKHPLETDTMLNELQVLSETTLKNTAANRALIIGRRQCAAGEQSGGMEGAK